MSELVRSVSQNDDDFYGDQEMTRETEGAMQQREVEALRRHHFNAGLREGASDARDATLQGGFDKGFAAGAEATAEPGFILGACSMLDAFYAKNKGRSRTEDRAEKREEDDTQLQDLENIRDSSKRVRVWLRAPAVQSKMDIRELRQACEKVVSLEMPDYPNANTTEEPEDVST